MPNQNSFTYPVRTLREQATALEAALSVCLAEPDLRAVHRLRTGTRRLEAQLLLLDLAATVPDHREAAAALRRELRRLRRAAGAVRDLDVHGQHLRALQEASPLPLAPHAPDASAADPASISSDAPPSPARASRPEAGSGPAAPASDTARLAHHLARKREKAAAVLQHLLARRQARTALATEHLLKILRSASALQLTADDLVRHAESVLYRDGLLRGERTGKLDEDDLHAVRKSAKLARYLAEAMPASPIAAAAAARFEALQEAGGLWHDDLEMARAARKYLGRHHELTSSLTASRKQNLAAYRQVLRALPTPTPAAKPALTAKSSSKPVLTAKPAPATTSAPVASKPPRQPATRPQPRRTQPTQPFPAPGDPAQSPSAKPRPTRSKTPRSKASRSKASRSKTSQSQPSPSGSAPANSTTPAPRPSRARTRRPPALPAPATGPTASTDTPPTPSL